MKIHHLRNATFVIQSKDKYILIDPMLSKKEELPPFSFIKHERKRNPTVDLPLGSEALLNKVTHCLITHSQTFGIKALQHTDHLDARGEHFLKEKNIPVISIKKDVSYLKKLGLKISHSLNFWEKTQVLDGYITAVPAKHGHGWIHKLMANGAGYFLELPDEPSIFISGDTVFTKDVEKALSEFRPDISVVAAGNASMDIGKPLLMNIEEVIRFIKLSPNKVIANHMEALNHCAITRDILKKELIKQNLLSKVYIPKDAELIEIN